MNDVVWSLEFALQLQESTEKEGRPLGQADGLDSSINEESPIMTSSGNDMITSSDSKCRYLTTSSSAEFNGSTKSYDSENLMSGAVFSELLNGNGR
ncbi:hypothetical protein MLD38_022555 [Melastoma candidum]|nr:hypothetical protein MLD38_022555 [Melastoma candidum]